MFACFTIVFFYQDPLSLCLLMSPPIIQLLVAPTEESLEPSPSRSTVVRRFLTAECELSLCLLMSPPSVQLLIAPTEESLEPSPSRSTVVRRFLTTECESSVTGTDYPT
ncbi:hypothetical protein PPTG_24996 [Phytophthora nicotianae INRA-310]|uniref:Secreted protein n=1 Tax=Phytophthora nicotianae (strain INRA-310) TaxID=761204 RepID=W2PAV1_PHYN3|nr:hypothetical protein PPTG_24996 [Phytophthora nicotianae INRA-310]ETM97348.1 hypothetical protein PPTG_24996 [Phytophthora nicotianae INRA-310]